MSPADRRAPGGGERVRGGVGGFVLNIIPTTSFDALARNDVLQVLCFAIIFGVSLALVGEPGKPVADLIEAVVSVDDCACQKKPEGCSSPKNYLDVGWSYVQFDSTRAQQLGLEPGTALMLVAEPLRITFFIDRSLSRTQIDAISPMRCPP